MVPGLDGNNIIILQYRVSDQTSALARVRIGATYIIKFLNCRLRHQGTKNIILLPFKPGTIDNLLPFKPGTGGNFFRLLCIVFLLDISGF